METNEQLKTTLVQEAEAEVMKLLLRVQELKVGDLKGVEHEVLKSVFALGRTMLERIIQAQSGTSKDPAQREGACGHAQRQVGQHPKQVLTFWGKSRSGGPITSVWDKRRRKLASCISLTSNRQRSVAVRRQCVVTPGSIHRPAAG